MAEKTVYERSLELHAEKVGKIEVNSKVVVENKDQLSLAYSPGVAEPCREIHKDPNNVFKYKNFIQCTNYIINHTLNSIYLKSSSLEEIE